MNVLSLFDGMSCGQIALQRLGLPIENYFAAEIDGHAIKVTKINFPNTIHLGDVKQVKVRDLPVIDLVIGGSPCQGFSFAGKQLNFEDPRSALFFEFSRILKEVKKINPDAKFMLENVRMKKSYLDIISEELGVEPILVNSDLFVQQNRERFYWFNWDMDPLPERPKWQGQFYQWRRTYFRENKSGVCPCLTANMGTGGHNVPLKSKDLKDKLTPIECEKLQGVKENYTAGVSNTQRYKMIGNGWTVPVITHIFKNIKCH